jgi:hypothetical protein
LISWPGNGDGWAIGIDFTPMEVLEEDRVMIATQVDAHGRSDGVGYTEQQSRQEGKEDVGTGITEPSCAWNRPSVTSSRRS